MGFSRHSKKILSLYSSFAVIAACVVYALLSYYTLFPTVSTSSLPLYFVSTDTKDPLRTSLLHSIAQAKKTISIITYSLADTAIIAALNKAAQAGVDVTIVYDPVATERLSLHPSIKAYGRKNHAIMHHKLIAIDDTEVWLGSTNMTTSSFFQHGNIMVHLTSSHTNSYIKHIQNIMIHNTKLTLDPLHILTKDQNITLFFHPEHGKISYETILHRIHTATSRVFVAMYTFTEKKLLQALLQAKERGVDVRVIFDKDSSLHTSKHAFLFCKHHNIRCGFRTKPGLLHYKTAIIDTTCVVGSCNWTKAGFAGNHEATLIIDPITDQQNIWLTNWWEHVEAASSLHKETTVATPSQHQ